MKILNTLGASLLVGSIASCAITKPPTEQEKTLAYSFKPQPGNALLYVYRPTGSIRFEAKHVVINQYSVGITGAGKFLVKSLKPGKYTISAGGDPIILQAVADHLYFIKQAPGAHYLGSSMPLGGAVAAPAPSFVFSAQLVPEDEGRLGVLKCNQAATGSY